MAANRPGAAGGRGPGALRRVDGIVRREVGAEVLLFDPRDDSLHVLNATGAFVWEQLDEARTADELIAGLREAFAIDPAARVEADVERLVEQLVERRLIARVER